MAGRLGETLANGVATPGHSQQEVEEHDRDLTGCWGCSLRSATGPRGITAGDVTAANCLHDAHYPTPQPEVPAPSSQTLLFKCSRQPPSVTLLTPREVMSCRCPSSPRAATEKERAEVSKKPGMR